MVVEWGPRISGEVMRSLNLDADTPCKFNSLDRSDMSVDDWIFDNDDVPYFLPADHPYYMATAKGFTYWPGGDEAPADWDRGDVLLRNGNDEGSGCVWKNRGWETDIIGYRKRTPQAIGSAQLDAPSGSNGTYYDITINGHAISCNDVIDALGLNFNRGEAFKALWRAGKKPGTPEIYDLNKLVYFATRERGRLS